MQTLVGSAFHTPVFSNCGARAGGRWRISGPGATPLMAGGSPGVEVSTVGRTGVRRPRFNPTRQDSDAERQCTERRDPVAESSHTPNELALLRLPFQYVMFASVRAAIVGGGPGGLFAATLLKQADPGGRGRRLRAQPAPGHVRVRRGVLRRHAAGHRRRRSPAAAGPDRPRRPLGRDRGPHPRRTVALRRQRNGGHRPHDAADGPPRAGRQRRGRPPLPARRARPAAPGLRLRPGRRRRRRQLRRPPSPRGRAAAVRQRGLGQVHLAGDDANSSTA